MGEIADALRRANADARSNRGDGHGEPTSSAMNSSELPKELPPPIAPSASHDSTYSDALKLEDSYEASAPDHAEPEAEAEECELEITDQEGPHSRARAVLVDQNGATAEAFRHFALRVNREAALLRNRALMVVSAVRGEGKTTTASNLALGLASITGDKLIALVDMDFRRPALGRYLGSKRAIGIDAVLRGEASLDQARVRTNFPNLDLYPVVRAVPKPHELLGSEILGEIISQLGSIYHTVIIDTPPVLLVPDVELMLPFCGGCISVVRSRVTRAEEYRHLVERLPKDKFMGTFLNETPRTFFGKGAKNYSYTDTEPSQPGHDDDYDERVERG
jgi:capsular exopolysaccharide synthesis family protein